MKKKSEILLLLSFLIAGFFIRWYLAVNAPQGIYWDMQTYHDYALKFIRGGWISDCCTKNVGYSFFLSLVYRIFGADNTGALSLVQISLDLITGLILYRTVIDIFNKFSGKIFFALYMLNPLTSAFTGMHLAENLTIFYLAVFIFIISRKDFLSRKIYWFSSGILLGLLLFTRVQFYYFVFVITGLFMFIYFKKADRIKFLTVSILGFLTISWYPLISNYSNFRTFSLTMPYSSFWGDLYKNFYNDRPYPELTGVTHLNPGYAAVANDFFKVKSPEGKSLYEQKYRSLFLEKISVDWPVFAENTLRNIFWLWNKDHLYTYIDKFYPSDRYPVMIYNFLLITGFITGLYRYYLKNKRSVFSSPVFLTSMVLFCYITLLFPLVSNESRHTIFFYPLIFMWIAYALHIFSGIKHKSNL